MKYLFFYPLLARELKRLAKENTTQGNDLSILDDVVFKTMLSSNSADSREALRSLLSACTRRKISTVRILNNEILPVYIGGKSPRIDVHVTFNDGETADLEMQAEKTDDDLRKRAEYYTSMLVAGQLPRGKSYRSIKRVYQIFFLNCVLFPGSSKFPRRYFYQEELEHDRLSETSEIIFYELPKLEHRFKELLSGSVKFESLTGEEKWCMYMKYRHEKRAGALIDRLRTEEEGIMRAEKEVVKVSRHYIRYARKMAAMKNNYERAMKYLLAEEAKEKARQEGREKGLAEGLSQGHTQGLAEGHAEGQDLATHKIARKMKANGYSLAEIAENTGLALDVVDKL